MLVLDRSVACMGTERKEIVEEVKKQLWLSVPLCIRGVLQNSLRMISLMFVGHLGELALASAALATSIASVTGFSILTGMAGALDTLCGQSFGAGQHRMLGIHMQRGMLIMLLVSIPLAILLANTKHLLIAMHQNQAISEEAGDYAFFMIPSVFGNAIILCFTKFLQNQNNVFPMMLSTGITTLLHILLCWILVFKTGLGSRGAALAMFISYWINALWLAIYIKFSSSCAKTWTGFSKEALDNILMFVKLAIPSAVMICVKEWSFQLLIILAGLLPNPQLETSVLSICRTTVSMLGKIPNGFSNAISIRVSNELGAGHPQAAGLAVRIALIMTITEGVLVGLVMVLVRNIWGHLYSNENEVIRYVASMMPILAISHFLDGIQILLIGIARGCGWQKIAAYVNLGSFYLVGLPLSILFAFVIHMKGKGLLLGIICALIMQVVFFLIITIRTNWEKQATKAVARVQKSAIPVS